LFGNVGCGPLPVTVTTKESLKINIYKLLFATVTERGPHPMETINLPSRNVPPAQIKGLIRPY